MFPELRGRASRLAVFVVVSTGVALTAYATYLRNVDANPMRIGRDAEGMIRWMTRKEMLEVKLSDARKRAEEQSDNKYAQQLAKVWERALAEEVSRLEAAGALDKPPKARDLRL